MEIEKFNVKELSLDDKRDTNGGFPGVFIAVFLLGVLWGFGTSVSDND